MSLKDINKEGRSLIFREHIRIVIHFLLLWASAGTLRWWNMWLYLGLFLMIQVIYTFWIVIMNPELFNVRGEKPENVEKFDKIFFFFYFITGLAYVIVSGLDERFSWTAVPLSLTILGSIVFILSFLFVTWAMVVNRHFEITVRIQEDRKHRVIQKGPYAFIRHPGYSASVFIFLGVPLILDSYWAFIPGVIAIAVLFWRTGKEDKVLKSGLEGYLSYTEKVRYRWLPGIW